MTELLREAFERAAELPEERQNQIAEMLLAGVASAKEFQLTPGQIEAVYKRYGA